MAFQTRCSACPCVRRPDARRQAERYTGKALAASLRSSLCLRAVVVLLQGSLLRRATLFVCVISGRVSGIQAVSETSRPNEWRGPQEEALVSSLLAIANAGAAHCHWRRGLCYTLRKAGETAKMSAEIVIGQRLDRWTRPMLNRPSVNALAMDLPRSFRDAAG